MRIIWTVTAGDTRITVAEYLLITKVSYSESLFFISFETITCKQEMCRLSVLPAKHRLCDESIVPSHVIYGHVSSHGITWPLSHLHLLISASSFWSHLSEAEGLCQMIPKSRGIDEAEVASSSQPLRSFLSLLFKEEIWTCSDWLRGVTSESPFLLA